MEHAEKVEDSTLENQEQAIPSDTKTTEQIPPPEDTTSPKQSSVVKKPTTPIKPNNRRKAPFKKPVKKITAQKAITPKVLRPYPRVTLEDSLSVAYKIKELNGGNPWASSQVAVAVGVGAKTDKFFYLTAASRDFGLTIGTRETAEIKLTDAGRDVVYAPNPQVEREKKIEAFLRIAIYKKVLEHYKGSSLPEMKYLSNTLEKEFGLDPSIHEEFSSLFKRNCQELGIEAGSDSAHQNGTYGNNGRTSTVPATVIVGEPKGTNKSKLKVFIIMPFVERNNDYPNGFFAEVLRSLITPAAIEAGFAVETANKHGSDIIQSTIINDLLEADLVIADLTSHNPNVLFELGVRMAENKPVALIKSTGTGKIFDVDNMLRVLEYDLNLWRSTIEKDLPKLVEHIKGAWENRDPNMSYMKILRRGVQANG